MAKPTMSDVLKNLEQIKSNVPLPMKDKKACQGWFERNFQYFAERITKYGVSFRSLDEYVFDLSVQCNREENEHPESVKELGEEHKKKWSTGARWQKLKSWDVMNDSELKVDDPQRCQGWIEGEYMKVLAEKIVQKGESFEDTDSYIKHLKYMCRVAKAWDEDGSTGYNEAADRHAAVWKHFDSTGVWPKKTETVVRQLAEKVFRKT